MLTNSTKVMALAKLSWHSTISNAQKKDITPSLSVRRCLFGPVDHEVVRNDLRREMKSQTDSSSRKWNFDFEKNTPLEGRFLWSKMNTTPEQYNESQSTVCNARISTESCLTTNTMKVLGCTKSSLKSTSKVDRNQPQSHRITGRDSIS